jgi:glycosyltransferase involved in cell wall biosynthesis
MSKASTAASAAAPAALPHVCFIAPAIYPVLARSTSIPSVGGAEVQQAILARTLRRAGHRVTVITMDYGQPARCEIDGIEVLRAHTPHGGLPVLRFLHPRISSIWSRMREADADIYYQRASGMLTWLVAQFCRRHGSRFVFAAASDGDFYPQLPLIQYRRDKWFYRRGVPLADAVVVQNPTQQRDCQAQFGRPSWIVPSCHELADGAGADPRGYALWVGTIKSLKRPELMLELARRLPQVRFRLVGGGDAALTARLQQAARALPNLELAGFVPYALVDREFDGARLFINTSEFEGFPNTFLQSWARGIPSVSFFDNGSRHDGLPVTHSVPDLDAMVATIAALMQDDARWQEASARARAYFQQQHTPQAALRAYQQVFAQLAPGRRRSAA